MRGWISGMKVFCNGGATSCSRFQLCSSGVSGCVHTGGDLVTSRIAGANDVGGMILLRGVDAVVRPNVIVGVEMLEAVGKKLKQSSWITVASICLCVCVCVLC